MLGYGLLAHGSDPKENNRRIVQLFTDAKLVPNDDKSPGRAPHDGDQKQIKNGSDDIDNYHLIIDTAARLFGRLGFKKTRVADIARDATAVCKKLLSKIEAKAEKVALPSSDSPAKRIRNLISAVQETHHKQAMHDRNLHKFVQAATAEKWAIIDEHNRRMTAIIEQLIVSGIAEGEFRPMGRVARCAPRQYGLHPLL